MQWDRLPTLSLKVFRYPLTKRDAEARLERRREHRHRAASRDPHAADAARIELRAGRDVIDRPHHVPHAPAEHGLTDEQRAARRRLARARAEPLARRDGVAPAPEGHRFDRDRRHARLDDLEGEVVLIALLAGPIAALVVDADDVVDAAAVTGDADHGGGRGLRLVGQQEVRQHADAGPCVEHELLAPVARKGARLECHRAKRCPLGGKAPDELGDFRTQLLLPRLRLASASGLEAQAPRRVGVQIARVRDGIELAAFDAFLHSGQRTDVRRAGRRLRGDRQGVRRRYAGGQLRELTTRDLAHSFQLPASSFQLPASSSPLPAPRFQLPASRFPLSASGFPLAASRCQRALILPSSYVSGQAESSAGSWKLEAEVYNSFASRA